ncbi:MAG: prolyl oligopeptidase family serine peptidase [Leptospiraceae bacterium]|nr:prolyl oligopeptidase family serine peptidase [Leptospiraceae bacterium]
MSTTNSSIRLSSALPDPGVMIVALLLFALLLPACAEAQPVNYHQEAFAAGRTVVTVPWYPDQSGGVAVTVYTPAQKPLLGNVLVLPGWKFSPSRWLNETNLQSLADEYRLRLICPAMHSSIYASQYYPETRLKWGPVPGQKWILERLLPDLQSRGVLRADQNNYLLGLSTGGRGVALLALARPNLFRAGAALSGDYDQSALPRDRLMTAVYGAYDRFPERWTGKDNPHQQVSKWQMPLYLAHGTIDRVVPYSQSASFYQALRSAHSGIEVVLQSPAAGHDFRFWGSQNKPAFDFFRKHRLP